MSPDHLIQERNDLRGALVGRFDSISPHAAAERLLATIPSLAPFPAANTSIEEDIEWIKRVLAALAHPFCEPPKTAKDF